MEGFEKEIGAANVKTVTDFLSKYGKQALSLFKKPGSDEIDFTKLLAMAGGAYAASRPSGSTPTGYQGKIPKLTATSNMLTAPPVGRRPGSGGINYGGGATFRDEKGNVVSSNEKTLEELRQAAINNPFNRGATYEGQQGGLGQSDLVALLNQLNPKPTTPTTPTTPVVGGGSGGGGSGGGSGNVVVGGGVPTPGATKPGGSAVSVPGQYGAIARPGYQQTPYTGATKGTPLPDGRILTAQGIYNPKTGDVITPDGYRVNAFGGAVTANKDTLSAEDAELMKGLTFSMDPNKDANASETYIANGIKSSPQIIREKGGNPDKVLEEEAEWQAKVTKKGMWFGAFRTQQKPSDPVKQPTTP
jgi:hypothetical protein